MKAQEESKRRREEDAESLRQVWENIGLPLICYETECRRARKCLGTPTSRTYGTQPCFWHYRQEMRFLLYSPGGLLALFNEKTQLDVEPAPGANAPPARSRRGRQPRTFLEMLFGSSRASLARLARPKDAPRPGGWERDPEAFERYFMSGDWRHPEGVCYRPPVRYGNRLVE